ncbi:MAG: adenylate cyclase [Paracoccaceae bacterium]|jgi:adenylate cyclase
MENAHMNRRLAAILAADVVGYSRLMAEDEAGTLAALHHHRAAEFDPAVARYNGRIVKLMGDGTLVEFTSVVDAVNCAVAIQQVQAAADSRIVLRIGINLGDIILHGDDIYGDGVNVAARLEPLARAGGICISSIVNESVGSRTDIVFSDGGQVSVKNIDRPLRVWHWHPDDTGGGATQPTPEDNQGGDETPSVAVLPFDNMSGDAEQEYFSDGISEDIITDLSKIPGMLVIARNSSFAYKGKSMDLRDVGRQLGVGAILEGSVRRAGNRVRITAQLIDTATGGHIWADRYDRDLTDIFAVQDEVTLEIVNALKVQLSPAQIATLSGGGPANVEAHDYFLRARGLLQSPNINAELYRHSQENFSRCLALDPTHAGAYGWQTILHLLDRMNGWTGTDPDALLEKAASLAAKAVDLAPDDPGGHVAVAMVARSRKDLKTTLASIDRAAALNPDFGPLLVTRGEVAVYSGRPLEAIPYLERAIRLNPSFNHQQLYFLGVAHLLLGHDETAAMLFRERLLLAKDTDSGRAMLASALGHLGEIDEARHIWADLMRINPTYSVENRLSMMAFDGVSDMSRIMDGFVKAGLPS